MSEYGDIEQSMQLFSDRAVDILRLELRIHGNAQTFVRTATEAYGTSRICETAKAHSLYLESACEGSADAFVAGGLVAAHLIHTFLPQYILREYELWIHFLRDPVTWLQPDATAASLLEDARQEYMRFDQFHPVIEAMSDELHGDDVELQMFFKGGFGLLIGAVDYMLEDKVDEIDARQSEMAEAIEGGYDWDEDLRRLNGDNDA